MDQMTESVKFLINQGVLGICLVAIGLFFVWSCRFLWKSIGKPFFVPPEGIIPKWFENDQRTKTRVAVATERLVDESRKQDEKLGVLVLYSTEEQRNSLELRLAAIEYLEWQKSKHPDPQDQLALNKAIDLVKSP